MVWALAEWELSSALALSLGFDAFGDRHEKLGMFTLFRIDEGVLARNIGASRDLAFLLPQFEWLFSTGLWSILPHSLQGS